MFFALWLFFVLLNGRWSIEIALIGLPTAAIGTALGCALLGWDIRREWKRTLKLPKDAAYCFILLWEIFKANIDVFKRVWSRREPRPEIVEMPRKFESEWQTALLANSITLTPGTITMRLSDDAVTVHCLDTELAEGLKDCVFEKHIEKMGDSTK